MTPAATVDERELVTLLDDVRRELGDVVDELDRTRVAHRTVETLFLAVLQHVPLLVVAVDDQLRIRATSAAAEQAWGASIDGPLSSLDDLDSAGVVEACRGAFELGHLPAGTVPAPFGAAMVDEPGTDARYVVVWSG